MGDYHIHVEHCCGIHDPSDNGHVGDGEMRITIGRSQEKMKEKTMVGTICFVHTRRGDFFQPE